MGGSKWLWRGLLALVLAVTMVVGFWLWIRGSLPVIDGELALPYLDASVEVIRDEHGIPHITAGNEEDALFALGFVHAQDRMWQMEMNRRIGAGRLSEVLGAAALDTDRLLRVLGLHHRAKASHDHLDTASRHKIAAYVRGVNAWIESRQGALPPEFLILGFDPAPWTATDSALLPKIMSLDLAREWTRDRMRLRLAEVLPPDRILDFYTPYSIDKPRGVIPPWSGPSSSQTSAGSRVAGASRSAPAIHPPGTHVPVADTAQSNPTPFRTLTALTPTGSHLGSNSWVVDGTRSLSGQPLLANDPHLALTAPSIWYLAHLSWPGTDIVGATLPGMPGVVLGHNGRVAWGFTNTGADVQDLFVERVDPTDPLRYLAPDGWRAFAVRSERIRIKDGEDVMLEVRETRHGPVIDDMFGGHLEGDGKEEVLSLAWTALRDDDLTLQTVLGFPHVRDWKSFVANIQNFHSPMQSITYADVNGNIGFIAPGLIPVRQGNRHERPGTVPQPGWQAKHDWQGFVPFEELPRVYNPPGGTIVTANHPIVPDHYPHHLSFEWAGGYRAQRIMERLAKRNRHDLESFRALQQDRISLFARALLRRLRTISDPPGASRTVTRALELLDDWDGDMDPTRPEPLVFHAWVWEFARLVSADELGTLQRDAWGRKGPFVQRVLEERGVWCDDDSTTPIETCDTMLARALGTAINRIARKYGDDPGTWRWGDEHMTTAEHQPFGQTVLARLFNLSGPAPGSMYAVNAFSFSPLEEERPFSADHGPGFRAIYDLADLERSLFIHSTGPSGNILSPWYRNFEKAWRDGEYFTIATERATYTANAAGHLRLVPEHRLNR